MTATRTHVYHGYTIYPVEYAQKYANGYRWYVQTYQCPTGMAWDSQNCPHFRTLKEAREIIDARVRLHAAHGFYSNLDGVRGIDVDESNRRALASLDAVTKAARKAGIR